MSTTRDASDLTADLAEWLSRYYHDDVVELARGYPEDRTSLAIDYYDLFRFDPDIGEDLLESPDQMHEYLDMALARVGDDLPVDVDLSDATVRVRNLPDHQTFGVAETRSRHIGQLIGLTGQVTKASQVKPFPQELAFECQRCGTPTIIPQGGGEIQEPAECQGCERQGPFDINQAQSMFVDRQVLRVQQPPEETHGGQGETLDVFVEDELAGSIEGGDRVTANGIMRLDADDLESSHGLDTALDGQAIEIEETDYEDIAIGPHEDRIESLAAGDAGDPYQLLVDSIAPDHHGDEDIKLAIALQLFGGTRIPREHGPDKRGDSHILLMGDPGAGKSSLLEWATHIAPRSVKASGKGATAAGLTASAVNDDFGDGAWSLEAGALVVGDGGVAAVDEIDKVEEDAVSSLHDALESQRVHVSKAGFNTSLPARTALLAAGNPKYGRFDHNEPYAEQIELGPTLLSRFDLTFMVSDQPDREQDTAIAEQMVRSRSIAAAAHSEHHDLSEDAAQEVRPAVDVEVLRAWIAAAKQRVTPIIEDENVQQYVREYYADLRQANGGGVDSPVPTTPRALEGIQRLAEASARVRLSNEVTTADIERAIDLMETSMEDVGIDPESGEMDADIIETGTSHSQTERMKLVEETIREHCSDGSAADMDELLGDLQAQEVSRQNALTTIKKLAREGEVVFYGASKPADADEVHHLDSLGGDA